MQCCPAYNYLTSFIFFDCNALGAEGEGGKKKSCYSFDDCDFCLFYLSPMSCISGGIFGLIWDFLFHVKLCGKASSFFLFSWLVGVFFSPSPPLLFWDQLTHQGRLVFPYHFSPWHAAVLFLVALTSGLKLISKIWSSIKLPVLAEYF